MGVVAYLSDSLRNAITGAGTRRDARTATTYAPVLPLTQPDIDAAYRGSGLMRKIIQIPAMDMVREWREWRAEADAVAAIEAEEKRLGLRGKIRSAETLRGLGGGALILGLPGDPAQPAPPSVSIGGLAYIHVVSRWHLSFDKIEDDARKPGYGEPVMWTMTTTAGQVRIHPSRVIPFRADTTAMLAAVATNPADVFWGESRVAQVLDAVKDSDAARGAFAALLHKTRLTRIGIPELSSIVSTPGGQAAITARLEVIALAESMFNATVFDAGSDGKGGEDISDVTYSFGGAKDILNAYAEFVSAISDIPATRLLGRAPEGMNSSGDSQQRDWDKRIIAMQTLELEPCMDRLDAYLIPSALGTGLPDGAWFEWSPLDTPSEQQRAERFAKEAEAIERVANLGAVPERAFNEGVQSWLIEEGYLPGLETALAAMPDDERYGVEPDLSAEQNDPQALQPKGGDQPAGAEGMNDAAPRPIYVRRDLLNAADLIAWALAHGLDTTLPASDMHVTVLYSRQSVDPMAMGETWGSEADGGLIVKAGGPRALEVFGEGALVLQFASWSLASRHADMIRAGASHDWPEYSPHVTLTYQVPEGFDPETVKPYAGELRFGPEIFEPLGLDWKSKIEEA